MMTCESRKHMRYLQVMSITANGSIPLRTLRSSLPSTSHEHLSIVRILDRLFSVPTEFIPSQRSFRVNVIQSSCRISVSGSLYGATRHSQEAGPYIVSNAYACFFSEASPMSEIIARSRHGPVWHFVHPTCVTVIYDESTMRKSMMLSPELPRMNGRACKTVCVPTPSKDGENGSRVPRGKDSELSLRSRNSTCRIEVENGLGTVPTEETRLGRHGFLAVVHSIPLDHWESDWPIRSAELYRVL